MANGNKSESTWDGGKHEELKGFFEILFSLSMVCLCNEVRSLWQHDCTESSNKSKRDANDFFGVFVIADFRHGGHGAEHDFVHNAVDRIGDDGNEQNKDAFDVLSEVFFGKMKVPEGEVFFDSPPKDSLAEGGTGRHDDSIGS